MNITDALARFLVQLHADGRSPHTIGQYKRHITALARWMAGNGHGLDVVHLDHEALALFLTSEAVQKRPDGKAKKASAVNTLRSSLRVFGSYLHRAGFVRQDPSQLVR